jgi:outer membrane receptor protein involved in Fe transport
VVDPQGMAVPGARVEAVSTSSRASRSTVTDMSGTYVLANVPAASYEVSFQLQGFKTVVSRAQVTVGAAVTLDASLELGELAETVSVIVAPARIDTRTPEVKTTIDQRQVSTLPTLTRNPYDFIALAGNVSLDDQVLATRGAGGFSINGQRAASVNVLLDGAQNNDEFTASIGEPVPLDAVQEYSIISANFSAQYGRATGGIVNLITKAGSNQFHGTGDYFYRNESMSTRTVDEQSRGLLKSPYSRHQPSLSVGGPIRKNVAQFFLAGEYTRVRSTKTDIAWVPAPEFLERSAASTQAYFAAFPYAGAPDGAVFTRDQVQAAAGSSLLTLSAGTPILQQIQYEVPADAGAGSPQNTLALVGRVDWVMGANRSAYVRYAVRHQDLLSGTNSYSPYLGFNSGSVGDDHNLLASFTRVWAANLTSQSKVVFSRLANDQPLGDRGVVPGLYMLSNVPATLGGIHVALPGYLPYAPGTAIPSGGPQTLLQFHHDQTWLKDRHDLRFGGSYVRIMDDRTFGAYETSVMTLGSNVANSLDNLMRGQMQQFEGAINPQGRFPGQILTLPAGPPDFTRHNRYNDYAAYANDSWNVARRVTLSLGVRYEYYGVQHNTDPSLDSNFYFGPGSSLPAQVRSGQVQRAPDSPIGGLWKPDTNNFAPRLGFAWDVQGNGRMSVRGGYGVAYERNFGNVTFNVIQNPPGYAVVSLLAGTDVPAIPITTNNAGPLAGAGATQLPPVTLRHVDQNITNAYAHFWSASIQKELPAATTVSVDYAGSKGVDLYLINRINGPGSGAVYLGDSSPASRENPQYGTISSRTNGGRSLYHGVTLGVETRNLARIGLRIDARYTLSHAQDDLSTTFSESNNNFNLGVLDPYNPSLDWGDASFDVRHRLVASAIWDVPGPSSGFARRILGGWQASGIFAAQSGLPFTVYDCSHANLTCNRMIAVGPLPTPEAAATNDPNNYAYLDLRSQQAGIGAYRNPITGTSDFGPYPATMTGRNVFRAPGRWNLDVAFDKRLELRAGHALRVRLELYNPLKHANLYIDTSSADISANTIITAVGGATSTLGVAGDGQRRFQVACKYEF